MYYSIIKEKKEDRIGGEKEVFLSKRQQQYFKSAMSQGFCVAWMFLKGFLCLCSLQCGSGEVDKSVKGRRLSGSQLGYWGKMTLGVC